MLMKWLFIIHHRDGECRQSQKQTLGPCVVCVHRCQISQLYHKVQHTSHFGPVADPWTTKVELKKKAPKCDTAAKH